MWNLFLFALGLLSVSLFPQQLSFESIVICTCCFLVATYRRCLCLMSVFAGLLSGVILAKALINQQLPVDLADKPVSVIGVVEGLPKSDDIKHRFLFRVQRTLDTDTLETSWLNGRLLQLRWYFYPQQAASIPPLKPGQQWQFRLKLRRPRGFVNPAGFDYQAYLLQQNISATGYVLKQQHLALPSQDCTLAWVSCLRWRLQQQVLEWSKHPQALGALVALVVGNTQWLTPDQWKLLRNTGTVHLLAISGLHIGLAASFGFILGYGLLRCLNLLLPFYRALQYLPAIFSIFFAANYSLLAGMGLSTQRALVMVVVFHVFRCLNYRVSAYFLLSSALCVVVLIDPLAMYSQGFWLSFLAVLLLLYGFLGRNYHHPGWWQRYVWPLCRAQWILVLGLFLPSIWLLQGVSLSGPVANIVAVTVVSLIVVPLLFMALLLLPLDILTGTEGVAYGAFWLAEITMVILLKGLSWIESVALPFWYWPVKTPSMATVVLSTVGVLWILSPKGVPYRYLGFLCFLPLWLVAAKPPALRITVMDVGQGTAIVVETPQHRLVYDVGQQFSERFNVGEHILSPYLRSLGHQYIDKVVISHWDKDHAGGLDGLLRTSNVGEVLSGPLISLAPRPLNSISVPMQTCRDGDAWQWDGVVFRILWPQATSTYDNNNNTSCVLSISYQGSHILLTGDIERQVENKLLKHKQLPATLDIMLVPHHGSQTSSGTAWVNRLKPHWAVVSSGYRNRYHHPHSMVIERYQGVGSEIVNTADSGALRWTLLDNKQWQLERWRKHYRRYWYD